MDHDLRDTGHSRGLTSARSRQDRAFHPFWAIVVRRRDSRRNPEILESRNPLIVNVLPIQKDQYLTIVGINISNVRFLSETCA